jgi:hypothetical protein
MHPFYFFLLYIIVGVITAGFESALSGDDLHKHDDTTMVIGVVVFPIIWLIWIYQLARKFMGMFVYLFTDRDIDEH